jgi:primosomal protein N' (replication factor Y)
MAALLKEMRRKRWVGAVTHQASPTAGSGVKGTNLPGAAGPLKDYIHPSHEASADPKGEISTAWERISGMITSGDGRPLLLQAHSLKAREEIYIRAAMAVTAAGGSVIILKPEIAAAEPFIEKLRGRFSGNLFITHSGLTEAARWDQWKRAAHTEPAVVVGARSTVLTAVKKLRLIIVDEEEEDAYKQEEIPRYHARDVALMRGREAECPVILGSSTPSVESLYLARAGEMERLQLGGEDAAVKPLIEVVDLKPVRRRGTISPLLQKRMMETLKEGGQVLLYLNRRGYSTFIQCRDCGFALRCHRCDISLTYHLKSGKARCRYCHHEESGLNTCPNCGGNKIWYLGMGTQKVEKQVRRLFPDAPVCRLDSDAAREGDGLPGLIEGIKRGEYRIVVSTQIGLPYLRGHEFSLSALIWADAILNLPDFRAAEKGFRAIWQLAGREASHKGGRRVVVQSFNPDHYSLSRASRLDYNGFVEEELRRREGSEYPPFSKMVSIRVEGGPGSGADSLASSIAGAARGEIPPDSQISVMGPTLVHLTRVRSRLRWQILLKGREEEEVKKLAGWLMERYAHRERGKKSVHVSVDVDPVGFS